MGAAQADGPDMIFSNSIDEDDRLTIYEAERPASAFAVVAPVIIENGGQFKPRRINQTVAMLGLVHPILCLIKLNHIVYTI